MDRIMTVDDLCSMFEEERKETFAKWAEAEDKEEECLKRGDHGSAAMWRKTAKRWDKRNKELKKILDEIYRMECHWRKGSD